MCEVTPRTFSNISSPLNYPALSHLAHHSLRSGHALEKHIVTRTCLLLEMVVRMVLVQKRAAQMAEDRVTVRTAHLVAALQSLDDNVTRRALTEVVRFLPQKLVEELVHGVLIGNFSQEFMSVSASELVPRRRGLALRNPHFYIFDGNPVVQLFVFRLGAVNAGAVKRLSACVAECILALATDYKAILSVFTEDHRVTMSAGTSN